MVQLTLGSRGRERLQGVRSEWPKTHNEYQMFSDSHIPWSSKKLEYHKNDGGWGKLFKSTQTQLFWMFIFSYTFYIDRSIFLNHIRHRHISIIKQMYIKRHYREN